MLTRGEVRMAWAAYHWMAKVNQDALCSTASGAVSRTRDGGR
jgi:hypothetical protein